MGMIDQLSARFEPGDHKQRPQGGQTLTYVPADKYIERLNQVLGAAWSWSVTKVHIEAGDKYAIVHGTLSYHVDGVTYSKDGVGMGQDLTTSKKEELDKIVKTANSEAIKNAAKLLGVGLYLYDEGERKEVEREMREPQRRHPPATTRPQQTPEDEAFSKAMVEARKIAKNAGQRVTDGQLTDALNKLVTEKSAQTTAPATAVINFVAKSIVGKPEILLNELTPKVNTEAPFVAGGAA
jgi:hypothetical protein